MEDESQKIILEEISKVKTDSLKKKLLKVQKITIERETIEKQYKKELLDLQYSYEEKYKNLYDLASKIVHGQMEPEVSQADLEKYSLTKPTTMAEMGVPNFWSKAIENAKYFYTNERDEAILKYLKNVRMEFKADKVSFTVYYTFDTNPYLSNTDITKSYIFNESQELTKIESSTINWASNEVNPTKNLKKTQKKSKGKKEKETTSQWEEVESFFTMFRTVNLEDPEAEADIGQEEEEAEFIREDLLPYALNYYLNIMPVEDECGSCDEDGEGEEHTHGNKKKGNQEGKEKCKNQ